MHRVPLVVCLALGLTCGLGGLGCDAKDPATKPADAPAKAPPAATPPVATPPMAGQPNPHAGSPHAPAAPAAPPLEIGPPRDVTPSGETREEIADGLVMVVPKEWESGEVQGNMRKASMVWPGPGGDANLLVYRFAGGAGTVEQNIDRWTGMVEVGDGPPAERIELEAGGLKISGIDVRGRFGAQAMPGVPPTPAFDDARMIALAVKGSGDPWYLKVVGPAKTVDLWGEAWTVMVAGLSAPAAAEGAAAPAP